MTGPEHYAEAERLTALAETVDWTDDPEHAARFARTALASAQVHATLALAAATMADALGIARTEAWREVLS